MAANLSKEIEEFEESSELFKQLILLIKDQVIYFYCMDLMNQLQNYQKKQHSFIVIFNKRSIELINLQEAIGLLFLLKIVIQKVVKFMKMKKR